VGSGLLDTRLTHRPQTGSHSGVAEGPLHRVLARVRLSPAAAPLGRDLVEVRHASSMALIPPSYRIQGIADPLNSALIDASP
jgi:hypothetical protein